MPELSGSTWSETDGSNNSASPNGMPEGMNSSGVNNSWRAHMGAHQRSWNRLNGRYASTGSANAYVLTPDVALAAYVTGERYSFRSNFANTGTATLNISGLGATTIQKMTSSGLANLGSGDIQNGQPVTVEYNGSVLVMTTPVAAAGAGGGGTVTSVATGDGLTGGPITTTGTVDLDLTNLTAETNPATDDEITIRDISASAYRKMTLANAMGVVTDLTELTSVDGAADFVLMYDTSTNTAKKALPDNLPSSGVSQATQAAIEAETNQDTYIPPDLLKHSPGVAKFWATFDGTAAGPISPSVDYNVVDVTDNGAGDYTINISTDFFGTDYAVGAMCSAAGDASPGIVSKEFGGTVTAGAYQIQVNEEAGTRFDPAFINVWGFGDQA